MDLDTTHQYGIAETSPRFELPVHQRTISDRSDDTVRPQVHVTSSSSILSSQAPSQWSLTPTVTSSKAPHRHTMMFLNSRPERPDTTTSRPLSMTAVPNVRDYEFQNLQEGYMPQSQILPPDVQLPRTAQPSLGTNNWLKRKSYGDLEYNTLEQDITEYSQGTMGIDDDTTIIDLRKLGYMNRDNIIDTYHNPSRRMSESTNSMSSHGPFADVSQIDDSPSSDILQPESDWSGYDAKRRSFAESMSSPRPTSLLRSVSRSRVSPAPSLRSSPYTLESTRNKRWSTGMYPAQPPPRPPQSNRYSSYFGTHLNPAAAMSAFQHEPINHIPMQNYLFPSMQLGSNTAMGFPTSDPFSDVPRQVPSHGIFRMLQSNADRLTGCNFQCADLSDPPDLYSALSEKPSDPPEEDMKASDADMVPHEQELRFPGDLYTPKWVRGQGNKREGWCGLCKPGRWLVLKNSAFWYDKSFTHGVSAATGAAFQGPQDTRRTDGNLDVWEGLCGSCNDWIALVSSKKKGTTWFRHAYKCHSHPKVKDGSKRRREPAPNANRSKEEVSVVEPTITISSGTPTPGDDVPEKKAVAIDSVEDVPADEQSQRTSVKIEEDQTPVSTPQLTHTSTPAWLMGSTQTPMSLHQPTPRDRKRYSVVFDSPVFTQTFSSKLEAFAEHEKEQTPPHDVEMATIIEDTTASAVEAVHTNQQSGSQSHSTATIGQDCQTTSTVSPLFTFNHDGTFAQMDSSQMDFVNGSNAQQPFYTNNHHFMFGDHGMNAFTSQHNHQFTFSVPTSEPFVSRTQHPPEGNWI